MQRIMTSAALVFAGALLLAGCTAGGGGSTTAADDPCQAVSSEVRDISNGAQNVLAAGGDPSEMQDSLDGYSERVTALDEEYGADTGTSEALGVLGEQIDAASEFASTLPADPEAEVDAEAVAEQQGAISEAATEVTNSCDAG
ncbi:hypothetical protein ACWEOH_06640 [Agromyces sp. NPDC004153]